MGVFKTPLRVEPLGSGLTWRLDEHLVWISDDGRYVEVPAGFETDFASVPRIFWSLAAPIGTYVRAAVLHDYFYQKHMFPRGRADAYFEEAMGDCGTGWVKRQMIWQQVRLWGWIAWNKYREAKAN